MNEVLGRSSVNSILADGRVTSLAPAVDALLQLKRPPARVLGIGPAAAPVAALLAQLGFPASALRLDDWLSSFVEQRLNVTSLADDIRAIGARCSSFGIVVIDLAAAQPNDRSLLADLSPALEPDALVLGIVRRDASSQESDGALDAFALELESRAFSSVRRGGERTSDAGWVLARRGMDAAGTVKSRGDGEASRFARAFLKLYFEIESLAKAQAQSAAAIKNLEGQTVAQARELAVLRWEILSVMKSQPLVEQVMKLRHVIGRRIPPSLRPSQIRRALGNARGRLKSLVPPQAGRRPTDRELALQLVPPILIADSSAPAQRIAESVDPKRVISVAPGAGFPNSLPLATANEPPLRGPAPGSLAEWLIHNDGRLTSVGSVVVNAADELSLSLLRGRLKRDQSLALTETEGVPSALVAELGQATEKRTSFSRYANFAESLA